MRVLQYTAVLSPALPPQQKVGYRSCTVLIWCLSDINIYMYLQWDNKGNKGNKGKKKVFK